MRPMAKSGMAAVMSAMASDIRVPPVSATLLGKNHGAFAREIGESFARFGFGRSLFPAIKARCTKALSR